MIELKDIHKSLGGREVLRGLNLRIEARETFAIMGYSGSGKSVTLKHMVGLMRPDKGEVWVEGGRVDTLGWKELGSVRRRFGFLFQSGALINWLSVFENVALPLREHTSLGSTEITKRVREKLALVRLLGHENKMPDQLSGGMRKRAGLARAIALDPQILLYDEPTAGLDPVIAGHIRKMMVRMREALGVTTVVVTHQIEDVIGIADRLGLLLGGKIVESGPPDVMLKSPRIRSFLAGQMELPAAHGAGARVIEGERSQREDSDT
jgi:phospholipid/cholesterol/gamma-HCH transport system ATP-binding protein